MIFPNHDQKLASVSMQMTIVFPTGTSMFKKNENVSNGDFSSLCQWFIDSNLSIYFREDKTKSIVFSKAGGLREISTREILRGPFH